MDKGPADRVKEWLERTGLPFEMIVAQAFRRVGFAVVQSTYYTDPREGTAREIDAVASRSITYADGPTVGVDLVIECKVSVDKPWVLFAHPDSWDEERYSGDRIATTAGEALLRRLQFRDEVRQLPLLTRRVHTAYAIGTAFKAADAKDVAYVAIMGATTAARAFAESRRGLGDQRIILPVVVVRGSMFSAELGPDNDVEVTRIHRGQLLWHDPTDLESSVLVDIVSESALDEFAQDAIDSAEGVLGQRSAAYGAYEDSLGF